MSAAARKYTGLVERIRDLTQDIRQLRIRLVEPDTIDFAAGQNIRLEVPPHAAAGEKVHRNYSFANPPSDSRGVELIVHRVPGGIATTWIFTVLREGDEVRFIGPFGRFGLSPTDRPMVWVAGGSGMSPFWSMLRQMREQKSRRECTYFYGALAVRDLFFTEELLEMEKGLPNFRYVPALSAPAPGDDWSGETGLITDVMDRRVTDVADKEFYLCGSGGMVTAALEVLRARGVPPDRILYDSFRR